MTESAEALAANLTSRRNITIEVTNITNDYCLIDPRVYLYSGNSHSPPQPTVRPLKTEVCSFTKTGGAMKGAVGLLSYDLCKRKHGAQEVLVMMFSVPYDYNLHCNMTALGIFKKETEIDEKLFNEMYEGEESTMFKRAKADGCGLTYEGANLDVKCNMSPMGRAIMKVEVWDKGLFSPPAQQNPHW